MGSPKHKTDQRDEGNPMRKSGRDPSSVPDYPQSRVFLPLSPTINCIRSIFNDMNEGTISLVLEVKAVDPFITTPPSDHTVTRSRWEIRPFLHGDEYILFGCNHT